MPARCELLSSSDPADTPALLELYLGIEPRSWKAQADADIGRHPQRIAYFRSLLEARQPMQVGIHLLLMDGVPVAGLISGAFERGLYALHIVYDDRLNRLGPGSTMLLLGMRQAIDGGFGFFNLLSGFGYFKVRWLAEATPLHVAQIYRTGSPLYWRRRFGDLKRRLMPHAAAAALPMFNPSRRAVADAQPPPPVFDARQRERMASLIGAVRGGHGVHLGKAQLAAHPAAGPRARGLRPPRPGRAGAAAVTAAGCRARLISSPTSMPPSAPGAPNCRMPA